MLPAPAEVSSVVGTLLSTSVLADVPVHVVSRRLGHADVQTTLNIHGDVTKDADLCRPKVCGRRRHPPLLPAVSRRAGHLPGRARWRTRDHRVRQPRPDPAHAPRPPADDAETKRRCASTSRLIAKLRGHGLIQKIPKCRRYWLTCHGQRLMPPSSWSMTATSPTPTPQRPDQPKLSPAPNNIHVGDASLEGNQMQPAQHRLFIRHRGRRIAVTGRRLAGHRVRRPQRPRRPARRQRPRRLQLLPGRQLDPAAEIPGLCPRRPVPRDIHRDQGTATTAVRPAKTSRRRRTTT